MPENKKRIVIASVLKPLNDTRMTEKIASSLADDPAFEVHVIGFPSAVPPDARITFHTYPTFKRLSFSRWFASARILRTLLQIKPSVIILTTHELLFAGAVSKLLLRAKLVYDVQENYYLNIRYTKAFPEFLKFPIATYVRLKERILTPFVNHFFLAEKVYAEQLRFVEGRFTVLENKATQAIHVRKTHAGKQLVFSGTLSRSTGVFQAIDLAKALHKQDESVTLKLIGYAALDPERAELNRVIRELPFITLIGGSRLVNHNEIIGALWNADAGVIAYEQNPATQGRIPTKLYEYLGCGLPVIFVDADPQWLTLASSASAEFIALTPSENYLPRVLPWLKTARHRGTFTEALSWKSEEIKLQTAISAL